MNNSYRENTFRDGGTADGLMKADKQLHPSGEKDRPRRARVHRSIYLEQAVFDRLGEAFKTTSHELYPLEVRKSAFVEACIDYALVHLPDIKAVLHKDR